jgi:hypothetical protein
MFSSLQIWIASGLVILLFVSSGCAQSSTDGEADAGADTDTDTDPPSSDDSDSGEAGTDTDTEDHACDREPRVMTTPDGVEFVRTPDSCFKDLPGFPYEARFVEIDGLRQGYVEHGPADAAPVLLLHGQPSWSYLYRKMIPVLAEAGHRAIAMDHIGMGRSDKPIDIEY